ncbi:MAG: polyprenyl synthetase family protein [Terracidiphilus sp.]
MHSAYVKNQLDTSFLAEAFGSSLPLPSVLDPNFECALRHVLDNPGSLIRPKLVFQMATAYGLARTHAQELAVALEYFHTASLLFDDLPCMDNALERRGAPCTHLVFGEEGAILTALALINRAYALTWRAIAGSQYAKKSEALSFLEKSLGVEGLLNGQSFDLHYSTLPRTLETTEHIARGKTVSLIRLTLVLPAKLGGASQRELQQIERISIFWGLGYQILDDLKDVLQVSAQTGKTPARDALMGRPNIAVAIGIRGAVQRLTRLIDLGDRAMRSLLVLRPELDFLKRLRGELQQELARVTRDSFELVEKSKP